MSSRQRVETALAPRQPNRNPADFLAMPEIWRQLVDHFDIEPANPGDDQFFDPAWEAVLDRLDIDCRVISFNQFGSPPAGAFGPQRRLEMWNVQSRSTAARTRHWKTGGFATDVFDRGFRLRIDVPPETFIEAVRDKKPQIFGMSALLTVTMPALKTTIEATVAASGRRP